MAALDLTGKTAIVTGASSGIGQATARALKDAGVRVAGGARRVDRLETDVKLELDVTDPESSERFVAAARRGSSEGLDILFNNAGLALGRAPFNESSEEDEARGVQHERQRARAHDAALPAAHSRRRPHRQHGLGRRPRRRTRTARPTSTSKFAVRGFTYALREDLLGRPIRITTVDGGLVETEFSIVRFKGDTEKADAVYKGVDPLVADDIADCVMWALTRPWHVNIDEIVVKARNQSSGARVFREQ